MIIFDKKWTNKNAIVRQYQIVSIATSNQQRCTQSIQSQTDINVAEIQHKADGKNIDSQ